MSELKYDVYSKTGILPRLLFAILRVTTPTKQENDGLSTSSSSAKRLVDPYHSKVRWSGKWITRSEGLNQWWAQATKFLIAISFTTEAVLEERIQSYSLISDLLIQSCVIHDTFSLIFLSPTKYSALLRFCWLTKICFWLRWYIA